MSLSSVHMVSGHTTFLHYQCTAQIPSGGLKMPNSYVIMPPLHGVWETLPGHRKYAECHRSFRRLIQTTVHELARTAVGKNFC